MKALCSEDTKGQISILGIKLKPKVNPTSFLCVIQLPVTGKSHLIHYMKLFTKEVKITAPPKTYQ